MKNQKLLFVVLSLILCWTSSYAQFLPQLESVAKIGGQGIDQVFETVIDTDDNVYISGTFDSAIDFDNGPGTEIITPNGNANAFIAKYDKAGVFQWVKHIEYPSLTYIKSMEIDSSRAIYLVGTFLNTTDFNPTGGGYPVTTNGDEDIFVLKLNLDGDFLWVKTFGGKTDDIPRDATVDQNQNIYITGYFKDTVDFNPDGAPLVHVSDALHNLFVLKLDSLGNTEWVKTNVGNGNFSVGTGISCDENNNVYLIGEYHVEIDFGPGFPILTGSVIFNLFVLKIQPDGTIVWVDKIAGPDFIHSSSVIYNPKDHFLYISGIYYGTIDFNPGSGTDIHTTIGGSNDMYITKWDTSGNFQWVNTYGNAGIESIKQLKFTNKNDILVTGTFTDTLDLDYGVGTFNVVSNGGIDVFLMKLNANGGFLGAFSQGNPSGDDVADLFMDSEGAMYCVGLFKDSVDFDPSSDSLYVSTNGQHDIFVQKFYACPFIDSIANNTTDLSVQLNAHAYQWINCSDNSPIIGATNPTFTPTVNGSYACILEFGACFDTTDCSSITLPLGIHEFSESTFKVYPVPFDQSLTIENENWESASVLLLDAMGRKVSDQVKMTSSSFSWQLPNLEIGVYFIEISLGLNELQTIKVMHQ